MGKFVKGTVVSKRRWDEGLYSLQVDAKVAPFQAGQFAMLALDINGEVVARAYSILSAPDETFLEFYFIVVPDGALTPRMAVLEAGDTILISLKAAGHLTLSEVPDAKHLWLLSTGTGVAPLFSILKTATPWQRFERIVLVHGVRYAYEIVYGETIRDFVRQHREQFCFVPLVTREETDFALRARIPEAIADGRLEVRAGIALVPETSQVMLCGNPAMAHDATEVLLARGLKRNRRHDPGHITQESY